MFTTKQDRRENPLIGFWSRRELVKVYHKGNPVCVNIEINKKCAGGCLYCYASSADSSKLQTDSLPVGKFNEILTKMNAKFGTSVVNLYGGDQLLHPDCREMVFSAIEMGFHVIMPLSSLISKTNANWMVEALQLAKSRNQEMFLGIHIDTLDQDVYDQVNNSPDTLKAKVEGYSTLLSIGFPAVCTYGCPTLTSQTAVTMIDLMNWFYGRGAKHVAIVPFRPVGFGKKDGAKWEPSLSQIKEVFQHRAQVEGSHMLMVGSSDGRYACQSHIAITASGDVTPCLLLPDLPVGNIYRDDIVNIVKHGKKKLLLQVAVKGPCATCVSRFVCCGCRANAHIYLGDITASDPKCFFNPEAPEKCL